MFEGSNTPGDYSVIRDQLFQASGPGSIGPSRIGPEPHPGFIDFSSGAATDDHSSGASGMAARIGIDDIFVFVHLRAQ